MLSASPSTNPAAERRSNVRLTVLVPFLGIVLAGLWVRDLVLFAVSTSPVLNVLIIGLGITAVGIAFLRAVDVDRDQAILARLHTFSTDNDIPSDQAWRRSAIIQAFKIIRNAAENEGMRSFQGVVEREAASLRSLLQQRVSLLQYMSGLLISLGLLGTFLGLLQTLISSSGILDAVSVSAGGEGGGDSTEQFANMIGALKAPLENMGTAFSSSLFGLLGSIVVGVMVLILQRTNTTNVNTFRTLMQSSQARLFSFKQAEKVDAEVVQDVLAAMLERERLAMVRSERSMESFAESLRTIAAISVRMDAIGTTLDGIAEKIGGLPVWCAENRDVSLLLRSLDEGLGRVDHRLENFGQVLVATDVWLRGQGGIAQKTLHEIGMDFRAQLVEAKAMSVQIEAMGGHLAGMNTQVSGLSETVTTLSSTAGAILAQGETGLGHLTELGAELRTQSRSASVAALHLGELATTQSGLRETFEVLRNDLARKADTTVRALERIDELTSQILAVADQSLTVGQGSLRQVLEALSRLDEARDEHQATNLRAVQMLETITDRMYGIEGQMEVIAGAVPSHRDQVGQFGAMLETLKELGLLAQAQAAGIDRLVERLSRIQALEEDHRGTLGEITVGQASQNQLLSNLLDAAKATVERGTALSAVAGRSADALERMETVLQATPRAVMISEQNAAISARLMAFADQFSALLHSQIELKGEANRVTTLLQTAIADTRAKDDIRFESLRQISVAVAQIAELLDSVTSSDSNQKHALRELEQSVRKLESGLKELAVLIMTGNDTEIHRLKGIIGRMEGRVRDLAQRFETWRNRD